MLISEKSQGIFQTRALGCFFIVKELYHIFLTHLKMPRGQMLTQRLKPKFFRIFLNRASPEGNKEKNFKRIGFAG